jgi:hypothetical protein
MTRLARDVQVEGMSRVSLSKERGRRTGFFELLQVESSSEHLSCSPRSK